MLISNTVSLVLHHDFTMAIKIVGNLMAFQVLTHKQLETHGCILSTVANDTLALKHQGISVHSTYQIPTALDQFETKTLYLQ